MQEAYKIIKKRGVKGLKMTLKANVKTRIAKLNEEITDIEKILAVNIRSLSPFDAWSLMDRKRDAVQRIRNLQERSQS